MQTTSEDVDRPLEELVTEFFDHLNNNSEYSLNTYRINFRQLGVEPLQFAKLAKEHPRQVERQLIHWLLSGSYSRNTCANVISHAKTLLDYCSAKEVAWERIRKNFPKGGAKKHDRKILQSEVRLIHDGASKRQRFLNLILYTGGPRVGSFYYNVMTRNGWKRFWPIVSDLQKFEVDGITIGKFTIYRGDSEEHFTFVTPECLEAWDTYRLEREYSGEKITDDSPLVVSEKEYDRGKFSCMTNSAIQDAYGQLWDSVDLTAAKRKFHSVHGFRKSFKTNLENAGMKTIHVRILMNHNTKLDGVYYRDDDDMPVDEMQIAKEYVKCIPALAISPVKILEETIKTVKAEKEAESSQFYINWKRSEERTDSLEKKLDLILRAGTLPENIQKELNEKFRKANASGN